MQTINISQPSTRHDVAYSLPNIDHDPFGPSPLQPKGNLEGSQRTQKRLLPVTVTDTCSGLGLGWGPLRRVVIKYLIHCGCSI